MSKINDDNYYQVSGWMLNRLQLKGTALDVFAIIYGFSQDGESFYTGSIQYLSDFTNTSKPTIIKALKELVEKGVVIKIENEMNGVKFCKYKANLPVVKNFDGGSKETLPPSKETLPGGSKETLPNNKDLNNKDILNNNIKYIVEHLNEKAGTKYKTDTKETIKLLTDLLTKGEKPYTVADVIMVIDKKCDEWIGTEFEQYLRPSTLFGNKFETYFNAKVIKKKDAVQGSTRQLQGRKEIVPDWMKKNKFNNAPERSYNMDELERQMLGVKTAGSDPELAQRVKDMKERLGAQ